MFEVQANSPLPSVAWVRALAWLTLLGASVGMLAMELALGPATWPALWGSNAMPLGTRRLLAGSMALGVVLTWLGAALWLRRRGAAAALPGLERAGDLGAPLLLAALLPGVASRAVWTDPLQAALVISAFVLALEPLVRRAL